MKTKNLINPLLWTLSFTAFLTSTNIVQACGDFICAASCCGGTGRCCYSSSGCCDDAGNSVPSVLPKVTPADILAYTQTKSHPDWNVRRGKNSTLIPKSEDQITDITVKKQKEGKFTVNYKIGGTPQSAIIELKGKASSS